MDDELKPSIDDSLETPRQPADDEPSIEIAEETIMASPGPEETREPVDDPAAVASSEEPELPSEEPELPSKEPELPAPAETPAASKPAAPGEEKIEGEDAEPKSENMQWYILKVQSNREDSIRQGLERRVKIAGLERYFGDVIVPIEKVTEVKGGRKRVIKRKLYPGYLVVQMEINDDTWFLVRETPGIGDFTGAAGRPSPMLAHEVARIVSTQEEKADAAPKLKIGFKLGDRVKINEGTFENFEGEVETIDEASGRVTVMINIFGRSTPVELEYWQVESL